MRTYHQPNTTATTVVAPAPPAPWTSSSLARTNTLISVLSLFVILVLLLPSVRRSAGRISSSFQGVITGSTVPGVPGAGSLHYFTPAPRSSSSSDELFLKASDCAIVISATTPTRRSCTREAIVAALNRSPDHLYPASRLPAYGRGHQSAIATVRPCHRRHRYPTLAFVRANNARCCSFC